MGRQLASLVIPSGASVSNSSPRLSNVGKMLIQAPGTLDALTFTVEGSIDGADWDALPGPVTLTANEFEPIDIPIGFVRVSASGNVAAQRVFKLAGDEYLTSM